MKIIYKRLLYFGIVLFIVLSFYLIYFHNNETNSTIFKIALCSSAQGDNFCFTLKDDILIFEYGTSKNELFLFKTDFIEKIIYKEETNLNNEEVEYLITLVENFLTYYNKRSVEYDQIIILDDTLFSLYYNKQIYITNIVPSKNADDDFHYIEECYNQLISILKKHITVDFHLGLRNEIIY